MSGTTANVRGRKKKKVICELCDDKEVRCPQPNAEHHFCARCWEKYNRNSRQIMKAYTQRKRLMAGELNGSDKL